MLTAVLLEDDLWTKVAEPRRQEWRLAIREVLDEHSFTGDYPQLMLRVLMKDDGITLRWEVPGQAQIAENLVHRGELDRVLVPYIDVCRQMMSLGDAPSGRVGELDREKKSWHDEGGSLVERLCAEVSPTHSTARRLFTLLVVLFVDTSTLSVLQRPHQTA